MVFIGRYHCAVSSYKSTSPATVVRNTFINTCRTNINNLGDNIHMIDFCMLFTIWLLYLVEFADWDSQACIGYGCGATDSKNYQQSGASTIPYHTGTAGKTITSYNKTIKYREIAFLWSIVRDYISGISYDLSQTKVEIALGLNHNEDEQYAKSIILEGSIVGTGYPAQFKVYKNDSIMMMWPIKFNNYNGATSDTARIVTSSASFRGYGFGGSSQEDSTKYGLFHLYAWVSASQNTDNSLGCRLMELP